jgi:hypothetical protein
MPLKSRPDAELHGHQWLATFRPAAIALHGHLRVLARSFARLSGSGLVRRITRRNVG